MRGREDIGVKSEDAAIGQDVPGRVVFMENANSPPGLALRHARALLECGKPLPDGLIDPTVARSWERSVLAGLAPYGQAAIAEHLAARQLAQAIERRSELLTRARPVMEYLYGQTRGSDSVVILADDNGVLLDALGDVTFQERAAHVALRPGASWQEGFRGTNAIGTALIEAAPGCWIFPATNTAVIHTLSGWSAPPPT
jgi:hypothetical protein